MFASTFPGPEFIAGENGDLEESLLMELILINASERSSKVFKQDQKCINFSPLIDKLHPLLERVDMGV